MGSKSSVLRGITLFGLAMFGLGLTPATTLAIQIERASSPILYMDTGDQMFASYAAYRIIHDSGPDIDDLWVEVGNFAGPAISLAPNEDGQVHLGALALGDTAFAYIYLQATNGTPILENHTVSAWDGIPGGGSFLGSQVFGLSAEETATSNSNNVFSAVNSPDPPGLGGTFTLVVTGSTGTMGSAKIFSMTPSAYLDWQADALQLVDVEMVMTGSANAGTYSDELHHVLAVNSDTPFTITYTFRVMAMTTQSSQYFPVQYISSGSAIRHAAGADPTTYGPVSAPNNHVVIEKTVSDPVVAGQDTVTYTVTLFNNSVSIDVDLDSILDDLPGSPDLTTYLPGSTTYLGSPVGDPQVAGQALTFTGPFTVPAADSAKLTYDVIFPATMGTYTNSATALIGGEQIDRTLSTLDDDPGSVDVIATQVEIGLAKELTSGPTNNQDGTYTLTYRFLLENSGSSALRNVELTDDLPTIFAGAIGYSVEAVSVVSGPLTANPGFSGAAPNDGVLTGTDSLLVGQTGSVDVTITVTPGANLGPYDNTATARGTALGNLTRTDVSTDGSDPDANTNGDPTDDSTPTPVTFSESPELGAAKRLSSGPINNGDGTYSLTYSFVVENSGDVSIQSLQLTEDLATAFSGAGGFSVDNVTVTGGGVTANGAFTGTAPNTGLLSGTDILGAGGTATLDLTITVTPGANLGPYNNTATASGTSPGGSPLSDASADGSVPDANTNGDPADDSQPTPVTFAESPELGVAKRISSGPVNNGDGTFTLTYSFVVENSGDVELDNVQLTDDLATVFSGVSGFTVDNLAATAGPLAVNGAFTGTAPNTDLFPGTGTLLPGATSTLDLTITVTPGAATGPFGNSASADGTSPSGTGVTDLSADGAIPDANSNGDPTDDSTVTSVSFNESPELGLAKRVSAGPANNGDGTYTLTYSFVVESSGDVELRNLQVTDNLATTFAGAIGFTVDNLVITGGPLTANGAYSGSGANTSLLSGTDILPAGQAGTLDLTVTVTPGGALGTFNNSATAAGTSPGGAGLNDTSTDGSVPDANTNGNPGDDSTPTPVTLAEAPELGVAKQLTAPPASNGDGTYTFTFAFVIENSGDVELGNVSLFDDLSTTFAAASGYSVDNLTVTGGPLTASGSYTGAGGNTNLLTGTSTLNPGQSGTLNLTVTVTPGSNLGPYGNSAQGEGTSPGGTLTADLSEDGNVPDGDGDGDPTNDSTVTSINFAENPELGLAKRVSFGPTSNGDGTYTVVYRVLAENSGDIVLSNVQITDDLGASFAGAAGFTVDNVMVSAGPFLVNPGYTGTGTNTDLLLGTGSLAAGQVGSVDITVTVTPGTNLGPYINQASGQGTSASNSIVSDLSTNGADPDPNSNGNPGDDSAPTPVTFVEDAEIGIAKRVSTPPASNGDGTFTLVYSFVIENSGTTPLSSVQVTDNLAATFSGASGFNVENLVVSSGGLTPNPGFTGIGPNTGMLTGSDVLLGGQSGTIDLTVTVSPGSNLGPYNNSASAEGLTPSLAAVTDLSHNGSNPDGDGDGDPTDDSAPTPVVFIETVEIGLAKAVTAGPLNNGDGTFTFTYTFTLENSGDVALQNVQINDNVNGVFPGGVSYTIDSIVTTSGPLTVDPGFTGAGGSRDLLIGNDILPGGQAGTVNLTLTVTPGGNLGPFDNQATTTAQSPSGDPAGDTSTNGSLPDANGNGDPTDDSAPTPVSFTETPEIGLAKTVSSGPTGNGDGTFTLTYSLLVENSGDVVLGSVQVFEDLTATFAGAAGFSVDDVTVSAGPLNANPAYTGVSPDTLLLTGTDNLTLGETSTVDITVTVDPGTTLGPFVNQAEVTALSPGLQPVTDTSTDGTDPDDNGNGDPTDDSTPTSIMIVESPELGAAKTITSGPTSNGDGTFTLTYSLLLENSGDVNLTGIEITEDLGAAFTGATGFTLDAVTVTGGSLTLDPGFTGVSPNTDLLTGTDALQAGQTATVEITVTVDAGLNLGPYNNSFTTRGTSVGGAMITDISTEGSVPDADTDGDPTNDNTVTSVTFTESPELGVAKTVSAGPISNGDGTYSLTYTILAENSGDVPLDAFQITENLGATFAGATGFTLDAVNLVSGPVNLNGSYTGSGANTSLLTGTDVVGPGQAVTIEILVTVTPGSNPGPYDNTASATATSPGSIPQSDISADGTVPDANGNGTPADDSTPTSVTLSETPRLGIAKRVLSPPVNNGDGTYGIIYEFTIENLGDVLLRDIQFSDDLSITFAGATGFVITAPVVTRGSLTVNPGYTGSGADTTLLAGTDDLAAGTVATVELGVTVTPGANLGPYANSATTWGTSPGSLMLVDQSTDGTEPDANGDGDPANDSSPTPVSFLENAVLGAAKALDVRPIDQGDGTHLLSYLLTVENLGDVPLRAVQLEDDLSRTFDGAIGFEVQSVVVHSGPISRNPDYTGSPPNTNLLTGTDVLNPGQQATIEIVLFVNPGFNSGPYLNSSVASGDAPSGTRLTDDSVNGTNPDPGGDGNPGNDTSPTSVSFSIEPDLVLLEKRSQKPVVVVGEMVQYEITATNNGLIPLFGIDIQDQTPPGFKYVDGSARLVRAGADSVLGTEDDEVNGIVPSGSRPLEFQNLSFDGDESIRIDYTLIVGSGVTQGEYINSASPLQSGNRVGNVAQAPVAVDDDPLFDRTTLIGKVFHDRDGDGWQDPVGATGLTVKGGFDTDSYLINSTSIDRGEGPRLTVDRGFVSPVVEGWNLGDFPGRVSTQQSEVGNRVKIEAILTEPIFKTLTIRTNEGTRIRIDPEGNITEHHVGAKAKGYSGQDIRVTRRVETDDELYKLTLIISNEGLSEAGIPGVRIVNPEGLVIETDAGGRYHLADVDGGRWYRGRNVVLKADPSTLPPGATFTTENPRLYRITPSLMGKVNFGVQLPPELTQRRGGSSDEDRKQKDYAGATRNETTDPEASNHDYLMNPKANPESWPKETASLVPTVSNHEGPSEPESLMASSSNETAFTAAELGGGTGEPWMSLLPGAGAVWATVDPSAVTPALNVGAPAVLMMKQDRLETPVRFSLWSNYNAFIERWEVLIYRESDEALAMPVRVLSGQDVMFANKTLWDGALDGGEYARPGDGFFYVLRAYGAMGHTDETGPRTIRFVDDAFPGDRTSPLESDEDNLPLEGGEVLGTSNLVRQTIPLRGGLVRVHGTGVERGVHIEVAGHPVPVNADGTFATELILPVGTHDVPVEAVDESGEVVRRVITAHVPDSHFFMVGIADLTVGSNNLSGSMEPVAADDNFEDDVQVDGRVAFYLKGKIKGKYLVSAQLDTQEEGLENLLDDIHKKDPRSILRRLDPDLYYPVYGDASTTELDVPSQGKMYARVDWDRSRLLWGNYHTGLTGNEFAQYNRSLYGAKLEHKSLKTNDHGEAQSEVTAFASEQQTAMGHDEFIGTGGSLYYLSHTDVVQGSEKVWIEIRDRDSQRVIDNITLQRYRDYELDDIQGRIILHRPLMQVANQVAPSIVRDEPLEGNNVVLLSDYEFIPRGFTAGQMSYGVRAKAQPGNHLGLGGTYVEENRTDENYQLWGVDGAARAGKGTYLKAEYAETESRQAATGRFSADGGLTFVEIPWAPDDTTGIGPAPDSLSLDRAAINLEARVDVTELTKGRTEASVGGWWKQRGAGFSTARTEGVGDRTEYGGEFLLRVAKAVMFSGRATSLEDTDPRDPGLVLLDRKRFSLQADVDATDRLRISGEARRVENELFGNDPATGTLGGLRVGYDITRNLNIYGIGQGTLARSGSYDENNLGTLGIDAWIRDILNVRAEGTSGNRGDAIRLGASLAVSNRFQVDLENQSGSLGAESKVGANWRLSDGHQLYGTFTMNTDRTEGKRSVFTVGQRKSLSNQLMLFTENQFTTSERRAGTNHVFGLEFEPTPEWTAGASWQTSNLRDIVTETITRHAISVWGGYQSNGAKTYSKLEYRRDKGLVTRTQWLTTNRANLRVSPNLDLIGKLNLSITEDAEDSREDARFVETSFGGAYRPFTVDRWQLLGKYTFLADMPSPGQLPARNDERMHVGAVESLYDLTRRVGIGGKAAIRFGETRADRAVGEWLESRTYLFVARGQYHLTRSWDAMLEYRWLQVVDADDWRHGVLVAGYRSLGDNLKAGLGYNFTDFTDDLTQLDYQNHGVFVNVVGTY